MEKRFLEFTKNFFNNMNIQTLMIDAHAPLPLEADLGLRKEISDAAPTSILSFKELDPLFIEKNIIYLCTDIYECHYILIPIPNQALFTVLLAGPYLTSRADINRTSHLCTELKIPKALHRFINQYFSTLPCILEQTLLENYLFTLAETIYGTGNFKIEYLKQESKNEISYVDSITQNSDENLMKRLEYRYEMEGKIIDAISRGDFHKAMHYSSNSTFHNIDNRSVNTLRSIKNNLLTFNTLCRKGAELGGVHPVHLDEMSRRVAVTIENMTSPEQDHEVHKDTLKKYCKLVQEKSTAGYSPTMQRVMNHILQNLTEPTLTLQSTAQTLSLSKPYLSSLFKKETNATFTSYVNNKRIEQAIFLLNTTDLQIQEIASSVGIPDVTYFTRIFQREKNMTPSQYRKLIHE